MRYLALTIPDNNGKAVFSDTDEGCHIYDQDLYKKCKHMTELYKNDTTIQTSYRKMVILSHPFEIIKADVYTSFIKDCPPLKMTNAFMKMWELLSWIEKNGYLKLPEDKLDMFDVASAPGMFIIAVDNYLRKNHPGVKLDWKSCSLEGGTALTDAYNLFAENPTRYKPCNVLDGDDIKKCITKKRYQLVTGDIGIYHEDSYDRLQEEVQLDLEWGQMVLALNQCDKGGNMILKMYSMVTLETVFLLDTLNKYFKHVFITKPYCTRLFNDESYIICINRNSKDCSDEPLKRPYISEYSSRNIELVKSFENARLDTKYRMIMFMKRVFEHKFSINKLTVESFKANEIYKSYCNEFDELFNIFKHFDFK